MSFNISQEELEQLEVLAPLSDKQEDFLNCQSDIVLWSGGQNSGKSFLCMLDLLMCAVDDKHFTATIARNTLKKVKQAGGLFDVGSSLFRPFDCSVNGMDMTFTFKNGARVKTSQVNEQNISAYQGTNNTRILLDEAAEKGIEESHLSYLITRLRGRSPQKKQIKLTGNPNSQSFLRKWLESGGYLDEDGYHREDMDGVETYIVQVDGTFEFFKSKGDIEEKYGRKYATQALSFTSFNANIYSNPVALSDPFNLHVLENLKPLEVERLLYGNWHTSDDAGGYLTKNMFRVIQSKDVPLGLPACRGWDFAASEIDEESSAATGRRKDKEPDWTVGIKCSYNKETGEFYILHMKRFREAAGKVMIELVHAAQVDTPRTYVALPQDPGSAGKILIGYQKARLQKDAHAKVVTDKSSSNKLQRAEPFIIAAQEGKVYVVDGVFEPAHWDELEAFDGSRSTRSYKDDIVDALAITYTALAQGSLIPTMRLDDEARKRLMTINGRTLI